MHFSVSRTVLWFHKGHVTCFELSVRHCYSNYRCRLSLSINVFSDYLKHDSVIERLSGVQLFPINHEPSRCRVRLTMWFRLSVGSRRYYMSTYCINGQILHWVLLSITRLEFPTSGSRRLVDGVPLDCGV